MTKSSKTHYFTIRVIFDNVASKKQALKLVRRTTLNKVVKLPKKPQDFYYDPNYMKIVRVVPL